MVQRVQGKKMYSAHYYVSIMIYFFVYLFDLFPLSSHTIFRISKPGLLLVKRELPRSASVVANDRKRSTQLQSIVKERWMPLLAMRKLPRNEFKKLSVKSSLKRPHIRYAPFFYKRDSPDSPACVGGQSTKRGVHNRPAQQSTFQ